MYKDFLEKVSPVFEGKTYMIPNPTLAPEERERRRLAYRNERILHKRKSSLSDTPIISMFSEESPYVIYSHEEWWSDAWDPMDYGRDFDFDRTFFDQFRKMQLEVPRPPLVNNKAENSDYCNFADSNRNSYLITSANDNEDCYYGFLMVRNKDCVDCLWCSDCELAYECKDCRSCYNLRFSENCENCRDGGFLVGCQGLENCFFCVNLRNKKYHLFNEPCSKEIYENMSNYLSGSHKSYQEALDNFEKLKIKFPVREANNFISSDNVSGNNLYNSHNCEKSFDVYDSEDVHYSHDGLKAKDCSDICFFDGTELCYESTSLMGYGYRFTSYCRDSSDLFYCDNCHGCKNCFGCCGLRNKEYCVFNKQYSAEDYEKLVPKIIEKMMETKEWGEFFPIENSLFPYEDTLANDFFPLEKKDEQQVDIAPNEIPDAIEHTGADICDQVLRCEITGKSFKVIPQEYRFYQKMKLPIPRTSPEARHLDRIRQRPPRSLWERSCQKCATAIETAYSPEQNEKIYCTKCYSGKIY